MRYHFFHDCITPKQHSIVYDKPHYGPPQLYYGSKRLFIAPATVWQEIQDAWSSFGKGPKSSCMNDGLDEDFISFLRFYFLHGTGLAWHVLLLWRRRKKKNPENLLPPNHDIGTRSACTSV